MVFKLYGLCFKLIASESYDVTRESFEQQWRVMIKEQQWRVVIKEQQWNYLLYCSTLYTRILTSEVDYDLCRVVGLAKGRRSY